MKEKETLSSVLRAAMLAKGWTFREVEARSGGRISNAYLNQLCTGKVKNPSVPKVRAIAEVLGIDPGRLLELL